MLNEGIKEAILNGAYGVTRNGCKVKFIGKSTLPSLELTFVVLPIGNINYYKPFNDINIIFVNEESFKAIPSTMEDNPYDIVGLWIEPSPKVILELPKPFKPKKNETFFTFTSDASYIPLTVRKTYNTGGSIDARLIEAGLCFRTERDAQAWVDALKGLVDE